MSTLILMKILESAPSRYDRGIRLLTLGKIGRVYDRLVSHIQTGWKVLDIGCGTGTLTIRAAQKGARVRGIDVNPSMLELARKKVREAGLDEYVELVERGIAELDDEPPEGYDAVMSGLCLSELSGDEVRFVFTQAERLLRPGALLLIADETVPPGIFRKGVSYLVRLPLVMLTYIMTQTTTRSIRGLPEKLESSGFTIKSCNRYLMGSLIEVVGVKG